MDSLLDFNFSEDSYDMDYSSDLLLSDGFNPNMEEEPIQHLLEPKMEVEDYLIDDLSPVSPLDDALSTDNSELFSNEQPPLPSEGMNMDIFELSFVPEDFDFLGVKSEPIPLHCAPLPEPSEKSNKRQASKKVKPESKKARVDVSPTKASRVAVRSHSESHKSKDDDKYQRRLLANKKSAQASRERKKALRSNLEDRVNSLADDNASLAEEMEKLESENKDLKREFDQLQQALSVKVTESSSMLSELMEEKPAEDAAASNPSSMYLLLLLYSMTQCLKTTPGSQMNNIVNPFTTRVPSPLAV